LYSTYNSYVSFPTNEGLQMTDVENESGWQAFNL